MAENVFAAAQGDGVADDLRAADRHQRCFPDLVEGAHLRLAGVGLAQGFQALAEALGRRPGDGFAAGQLAKAFELVGDVFHLVRLRDIDGQAERLQLADLRHVVAAFPGQHEIWLQRGDGFQVDARIAADARHLLRFRRVVAVIDGADQLVARPGGEQAFGDMRGEGDDALGRRLEADFLAGVVLEAEISLGAAAQDEGCGQEREVARFHAGFHSFRAVASRCQPASSAGRPQRSRGCWSKRRVRMARRAR